ncbi:MAG: membrane dipeptidase [Phycisphaerales bacterium]|nr:membrane dipeptidase [Phycisphaerales bacterium]
MSPPIPFPIPPAKRILPWFDAHLDLAYLAVNGRDMLAPLNSSSPPHAPASVTLSSLKEGRVRLALGTIFTEPGGDTTKWKEAYAAGDFERAHAVGRAQLEVYLTWRDRGLISLDRFASVKLDEGVGEIRGGMGVSALVPFPLYFRLARLDPKSPPLHVGILIENADPIRSPDELPWWRDRGVVAIGLAWAKSSRYAGGNTTTEGLSDAGHAMVREMDRLGIVHDAAHLSDRAFAELCDATAKPIIASHSNCRAVLGDPAAQRHVSDAQIREIVRRDGVVGLNLYTKFLDPALKDAGRASIERTLAHVEHVCMLAGSTRHAALGTDMDGGFAADRMPEGIDTPAGLDRLLEGLARKGWGDEDLAAFACENWGRIFA